MRIHANISKYKKFVGSKEAGLGIFSKKHKRAEGLVGVCQDASGISLAHVRRDKEGVPALLGCHWIEAGEDLLEPLVKQQQLQGIDCVSVLSAEGYQLMQAELADLSIEEKRDAARWQIREMLSYPAEEAVLDLYEVAPFASDKKPLTYVVVAREKLLRGRVEPLTRAGLKVSAIDIAELALRNLTDLYREDSRGVAILLLLDNDGLLIIAREGTLYLTRSLSIGMNALLPFADGNIEALTEQVDAIVLEIQRSFDYCESSFHLPVVSRLLVAQTQREIPAVIKYLDDFLATRVEPLRFDGVLKVPEGIDQLELNRHLLAIGGALRQEHG
jgi:MSHA biogenesis protein MshI